MAAPLLKGGALVRQRVLGLVFLVVLALLVGLTVALYRKSFTSSVDVLLRADRVGNQLTTGADVKLRGLVVGRVSRVESTAAGAVLTLALQPDRSTLVPADVSARLLPKTLFGEKFVALVAPDHPADRPLRAGDVIGEDRTSTGIETERVLGDLLPVLQALRPAQLSLTLNALSSTLRGRGDALGANLVRTDAYLARINPELPGIRRNLRGLADLAQTYDAAAPDVLGLLDNLSGLGRDLVDEQPSLAGFLAATTGSTAELDRFLRRDGDRLVTLARDSRGSLAAYARYAPEYPCLFAGLVAAEPAVEDSFGRRQPGLHITLEQTKAQGGYRPGDEPRYGDDGGPTCRGLPPNAREIPFPVYRNGVDGYRDGQPVDPRTGEYGSPSPSPAGPAAGPVALRSSDDLLTKAVAGAVLREPLQDVPDVVTLLFGPLARGTDVSLS